MNVCLRGYRGANKQHKQKQSTTQVRPAEGRPRGWYCYMTQHSATVWTCFTMSACYAAVVPCSSFWFPLLCFIASTTTSAPAPAWLYLKITAIHRDNGLGSWTRGLSHKREFAGTATIERSATGSIDVNANRVFVARRDTPLLW